MVIETLIDILGHLERLGILDTEEPHERGHQDLGATVFEERAPSIGNQRPSDENCRPCVLSKCA